MLVTGKRLLFTSILVINTGNFLDDIRQFSSHYCGDESESFVTGCLAFSSCDCGDELGYFKPTRDIFLTLTKSFLSLNRSVFTA